MSWLKEVMEATKDQESPKQYIYWSALSAISAVVKNNIYLQKDSYKLYPNIYVMLIGHSGIGKGFPILMAKTMVTLVGNNRVVSGRNSIQGIIKTLSTTTTSENGGPPLIDATGFIISGEVSTLIIEDPTALTILTDWYDTHAHQGKLIWENTLRNSDVEKLKNLCVSVLGASNGVHFSDFLPPTAISGGFIGRTLLVLAKKKNKLNSMIRKSKTEFDIEKLSEYLKKLSKLEGGFKWASESLMDYYDEWFYSYYGTDHEDKTGTSERMKDHVLKVAMLLSLARSSDMTLQKEDISASIKSCMEFTVNVDRVTLGKGKKSEVGNQTEIVLKELINREDNMITKSRLLRNHYGDLDVYSLERAVDTLVQARSVTVHLAKINGVNETVYKLTPWIIDRFNAIKDGSE